MIRFSDRQVYYLKILVGLIVLGCLVSIVGWGEFVKNLREISLTYFLIVAIIALIRSVIESLQMRLILKYVSAPVSLGLVFRANAYSALYGMIVPGSIASSGAKWLYLTRVSGKNSEVLVAIACNRLLIVLPSLLIGATAFLADSPFQETSMRHSSIVALAIILLILIWIAGPDFFSLKAKALQLVTRKSSDYIANGIRKAAIAVNQIRTLQFKQHVALLAIAVVIVLIDIGILFICLKAFDYTVSLLALAWIFTILQVASHLPISIGNLGVREGILAVLLATYGVPPGVAISIGLLMFAADQLVMVMIGAGFQFASLFRQPK